MPVDIAAIQSALAADGLDGWLLYDFRGLNPIAGRMAGLETRGHMATRRWYYFIPATGDPRGLVHAIERHVLDAAPGAKATYAGHEQLAAGLRGLVAGARRVAMEYSPRCAIPTVSRVDAGTVEMIRDLGVEVVSSGDLVQRFQACWDRRSIASHLEASAALYRVKDRAFEAIATRLAGHIRTTEYDIQQLMAGWFRDEGLASDSDPMVSAQENAGNPHYLPTVEASRVIGRDEIVLLDLWGKHERPGAVYADITWVGYTGRQVPEQPARAFQAIREARDAVVAAVESGARARRPIRGFELDRVARQVIADRGFARGILHRTGHSLGESVHGDGANLDDYETHDDRRLLPGAGFTVEPGVYFESFGVRTEINMVLGDGEATVTGPLQQEIVALA